MHKKIHAHNSILPLIGKTPLVQLQKTVSGFDGEFYAKLEAFNPGHSAKDRIAHHIITIAEEKGLLNPGDTIIEDLHLILNVSRPYVFSLAKRLDVSHRSPPNACTSA
mgnify:CR=1 FL=1